MPKYIEEEIQDDIESKSESPEKDEYSWAIELKHQLEKALEIWIASAFVDMRAVEVLGRIINSLPRSKGREIRILLDRDFHENPLAREAIINRLYSLPNTVIRLADTKEKFHPKCFVFNHGSTTSCLVGSMNLTSSAMDKNVEFGIFSDHPEDVKKCRDFFLDYWKTGQEAPKTERVDYPNQRFKCGDTVKHTITGNIGCVHKVDNSQEPFRYNVFFKTGLEWVNEDELEKARSAIIPLPDRVPKEKAINCTNELDEFTYNYISRRYLAPAEAGFYTTLTSRIHEYWYQQIPLIKILNLLRPRLLIADEVGLGKTIEAGLIIREMMARMPLCNKIMIVCPNNLVPKWELEMRIRFGLYFSVHKGKGVADGIRLISKAGGQRSVKIITSYEALRSDANISLIKQAQPTLDIIVCDEAHHLRNESKQKAAIKALTHSARCFLMLTATPISLSNQELRILLGILDPEEYKQLDQTRWIAFVRPNLYISRLYTALSECIERNKDEIVELDNRVIKECAYITKNVLGTTLYGSRFPIDHPLTRTVAQIQDFFKKGEVHLGVMEACDLAERVIAANILAKNITKTRKQDVGEFKVREIKTIRITLENEEEKRRFKLLGKAAKKDYTNQGSRLVAYSRLRRASSCLPVVDEKLISYADDGGDADIVQKGQDWTPSFEMLEFEDSKYNKLREIISQISKKDVDYRILVFSVFQRTIKYLEARINMDFGIGVAAVVYGPIGIEDRYKAYEEFSVHGFPHILICSEVASEGVDLQCCNILVNYDLPWNPTVVEQRIGRIDRLGQKADKLYIYNFVVDGTVEEIIYARLDYRLTETRDTLGPVADVLGNLERKLPDLILNSKFSDSERDKFVRKMQITLRQAQKKEEIISRESTRLVGSLEIFKKDFERRKRNTIDHAISVARHVMTRNTELFSIVREDDKEIIKINRHKIPTLLKDLNRYLVTEGFAEQRKYLLPNIARGNFEAVFSHDAALKSYKEFLNVDHPLIRFLVSSKRSLNQSDGIRYLTTKSSDVPIGIYLIFEYITEVMLGSVKYDFCFHQSAFSILDGRIDYVKKPSVLAGLFDFSKWGCGKSLKIPEELVAKAERIARETAEELFNQEYERIAGRLKIEMNQRKIAVDEMFFKEKQQIKESLEKTIDPNKRKAILREYGNIEREIERRRSEGYSENDLVFSPRLLLINGIRRDCE